MLPDPEPAVWATLLVQRENVRSVQNRNVRFNGVSHITGVGRDDDHDEPEGSRQTAGA